MGERAARYAQEQDGEAVAFKVRGVIKATITSNYYNHADELKVTVAWRDVGVDLGCCAMPWGASTSATPTIRDSGTSSPKRIRVSSGPRRAPKGAASTEAMTVDFSSSSTTRRSFWRRNPSETSGIPNLSMRLDEAWRTICSERWVRQRARRPYPLGRAHDVPAALVGRFCALREPRQGADETAHRRRGRCGCNAVGMMGLISYIKQDECIVTNATTTTRRDRPAPAHLGKNIKRMSESTQPASAQGHRAPIVRSALGQGHRGGVAALRR